MFINCNTGSSHRRCLLTVRAGISITYYLILSINLLQLLCHLQGPIWASVVNDNDLVFVSAVNTTNQTEACALVRPVLYLQHTQTQLDKYIKRYISELRQASSAENKLYCRLDAMNLGNRRQKHRAELSPPHWCSDSSSLTAVTLASISRGSFAGSPELTFHRNTSPEATLSKAGSLFRCRLATVPSICPHRLGLGAKFFGLPWRRESTVTTPREATTNVPHNILFSIFKIHRVLSNYIG